MLSMEFARVISFMVFSRASFSLWEIAIILTSIVLPATLRVHNDLAAKTEEKHFRMHELLWLRFPMQVTKMDTVFGG